MVLYHLFTGITFFHCDQHDNIEEEQLLQLMQFEDSFKEKKLSVIENPAARSLVSALLMKNPEDRISTEQMLQHEFLNTQTKTNQNLEFKYDVYIAHRSASDGSMAVELAEMLSAKGLRVCLDRNSSSENSFTLEEMASAIFQSHVFVPIFSRSALNNPHVPSMNLTKLREDSPSDRLLLECRLALEFSSRNRIGLINPVLVGDKVNRFGQSQHETTYSDFIVGRCLPSLSQVVVRSVEEDFIKLVKRFSSKDNQKPSPVSIKSLLDQILVNEGSSIEGDGGTAILNAFSRIMNEATNLSLE
jgi:serine/threonine protein kinase